MLKYKIIADSTAGFSKEEIEKYNLEVLPLTLSYKGKEYKDGIDITTDKFYEMFFNDNEKRKFFRISSFSRDNDEFPKTSQVSPAMFVETYERIIKEGYTPVVIPITSVLSGTYRSALLAKDIVDDENIVVIDSQTAIGAVKVLIKAIMKKEYETKEDLINEAERLKKRVNYLAVMDTLEYVAKGGRMGKFSAGIGNLLHFKPIMQLDYKGTIVPVAKPRGLKHAFAGISDMLVDEPIDFNYDYEFGYSTEIENLQGLIAACKPHIDDNYSIGQISPVIGVHVGPRASALFYISTKDLDKKLIKE